MRFERIRSRVSASGACLSTTSSNVAFASSIIAHNSPPCASMPWRSKRAGSTRRSVFPSSGRPSESASRFAGSIVSTATFLPRAAMPAAIAAEVVVLPTPPEPAQMHTRLSARRSATDAVGGDRGELLGLGVVEALGVQPVAVDAVDLHPDPLGEVLLELRRLVDRH